MEQPLASLVKTLPLTDEIKNALLHRKGIMGEALNSTFAFELSDWKNVKFSTLGKLDLIKVNLEAFKWANEVTRSLH